jgi:hypothetical protein
MTHFSSDLLREKVNLETAQMPWRQLQRFFASGRALFVAPELDLVDVAYQISVDNKTQVAQWLAENKLGKVTDAQATAWFENDAVVWAVVVRPWLLVQG